MNLYLQKVWNSKLLLSLISGLFLGFSYPPFPFPFLTLPAFVCVFRIIDLSSSARDAAFWTYPGFLIWNIIATYWLTLATVAGGVAAILANAAVMTLPVMLQYKFQRSHLSPWLVALFQTASWISFEYLHHHWDLAWPWLTVSNAWSSVPTLIQYISTTGFWGISFWILLSASLIYQTFKTADRKLGLISGSLFLAFPLLSMIMLWGSSPQQDIKTQEVVVVQPNFNSYQEFGGYANASRATNHLLKLSDSVRTPNTQLIVWPENAIQSDISNMDSFGGITDRAKMRLSKTTQQWQTNIIGGATYFEFYKTDQAPSLPYYNSTDRAYLPFNAALKFSPEQQPLRVYRKHNLVPIVERVPYVYFLNTIDIFGWVNWNNIQGYGMGHNPDQFTVGETRTPALICYDSVYPSWVRNFVQSEAGYLTIITNDGWWGNTSGHAQHFAYARLRAIEFGRWIVRSANNGISGIIAPDGSTKIKTAYKETTAFRYEVPALTSQTFYTRFGDWLPQLLLLLTVTSIAYLSWKSD